LPANCLQGPGSRLAGSREGSAQSVG
jgi:hypothetical protein